MVGRLSLNYWASSLGRTGRVLITGFLQYRPFPLFPSGRIMCLAIKQVRMFLRYLTIYQTQTLKDEHYAKY